MRKIAIVGGGPAGSLCAERLARAGFPVTVFDEHLAWEKPCGGGLTDKAVRAYPFLLDNPHPKKLIRSVELISSQGPRAKFTLNRPIVIYSRATLNGLLLERAVAAGCRVVHARVTRVHTREDPVRLRAGDDEHGADFVILAAGARNNLLPETCPLGPDDLELTVGYFVPAQSDLMKIKFVQGLHGYLWVFPRWDHLSVGICGSMARHTSQELRTHLVDFLREEKVDLAQARFYSHILPSPQPQTLRQRRLVGKNWALAGDAAACVDPITGEGLYYALRSGDLLAEALAAGKPQDYPERIRAEFAADLEIAARIAQHFYHGRFLGSTVIRRMIQFTRRSATFRALMADVFSGAQDYRTLKRRVWSQLAWTLSEVLASALRLAPRLPAEAPGVERVP